MAELSEKLSYLKSYNIINQISRHLSAVIFVEYQFAIDQGMLQIDIEILGAGEPKSRRVEHVVISIEHVHLASAIDHRHVSGKEAHVSLQSPWGCHRPYLTPSAFQLTLYSVC